MTSLEYITEVSERLDLPDNNNVESAKLDKSLKSAFQELKRYMKTPVEKTVPYNKRIDLERVGVFTKQKILNVIPSRPRMGMLPQSIEGGNTFQIAAAVNTLNTAGNSGRMNIDRLVGEMGRAQIRNTLATDFQFRHDTLNKVVYVAHRPPLPTQVTIRYVPEFQDVSEIISDTWIDYLIRLTEAHHKKKLGRSRTKYKVDGSNVSNDGDTILAEANAELEAIRAELEGKKRKLIVVN